MQNNRKLQNMQNMQNVHIFGHSVTMKYHQQTALSHTKVLKCRMILLYTTILALLYTDVHF